MRDGHTYSYYIVAIVLVLLFVLITIIRIQPYAQNDTIVRSGNGNVIQTATASLALVFGDNTIRKFEGDIVQDMTILDALIAASSAGNFVLTYDIENNQAVITTIDGLDLENGICDPLCFYVNSAYIEVDLINEFVLEDGDFVEVSTHELYQ